MDSSSVCVRKQGKRWWRKTQEISFKTLLIKTPLLIGSISSQFSGENSFKQVEAQSPLKILVKNNAQSPKFIELEKLAVGVCQTCRSTDQRSYFRPLSYRSTDQDTESSALCPVDRSVDRGLSREHCSLDGRPTRSTGPPVHTGVHVCARRSTARSTDFSLRSTGRSTG